MSGALAFVASSEPAAEAVARHLAGAGDLLTGPAAALRPRLAGRAVVVYGAAWRARGPHSPVDLDDARAVLTAAAEAGCRMVLLSSTEIYAPHHHHPGLLSEDRFQPRPGRNRWSDGWRALEALAGEVAAAAEVALTVLRAAPTPVPGGTDFWSRRLSGPLAPTVPGFDPSIQLLAAEDLARAIGRAAVGGGSGVFNVVPDGTVPVHRAVRLAGARRLAVPRWVQRLTRRLTQGAAAADRVDFLRYPWTAGGERARSELEFAAAVSSAEVAARLRGGPVEEREARGVDPSWEWGREGLDPFGMDRGYIHRYGRTLFRFLHDAYWRIEHRGLEHVPREGPGVLTGVHRGFMPYDGVMALHLLARERGRYPRFLLHPTLVKLPFLANFMTKLGGILACQENAGWVLERGGLVGIFPEGIRGAFTPYRRAYRLGKMGRDEYVRIALRHRAPILPFVTVGSAEIFPILARLDWGWWKRLTEWPCFPIAPPFPLLPVPLPSKWHTRFLEPLHVETEHGPEAADDPAVVRAISREVRRRMEKALADLLARRRSIFFGTVFDEPAGRGEGV